MLTYLSPSRLTVYNLEKFGRRKPLIWGAAWMVIWLCVFGGAGTGGDPTKYGIAVTQIVAAVMFSECY